MRGFRRVEKPQQKPAESVSKDAPPTNDNSNGNSFETPQVPSSNVVNGNGRTSENSEDTNRR